MSIPDFQSIMLPLLQLVSDGKEHYVPEAREELAHRFELTKDERRKLLPSRTQPVFDNRVGWAKSHLKQACLVENLKRGYFRITKRGLEVLEEGPAEITIGYLERFPEFQAFRQKSKKDQQPDSPDDPDVDEKDSTPDETMDSAHALMRRSLGKELLEQIKGCSPAFFERLVVDLLLQMGYGNFRGDAGSVVGGSGDNGIDGVIEEDKLGLDVVYIQAKRWEGNVGRPEIQKFAGALQGHKAKKGVFITTSGFTREAETYAALIETRIVLVDGIRLAELMIDHNVGVTVKAKYEIKRIDSDYFIED
jgi:restriction system protein